MPFPVSFWKSSVVLATFSDDFNRSNASPVSSPSSSGGTWGSGAIGASGGFQIVTNKIVGLTGAENVLRASAPTFTNNQSASCAINNFSGAYYGPAVRVQGSSNSSCYLANVSGSNTTVTICKMTDSGTISTPILKTVTGLSLVAGDVITLKATGTTTTTLNFYVNGVLTDTTSDASSAFTGGQPGIYSYNTNGVIPGTFAATDA